jgi:hypothetical protein
MGKDQPKLEPLVTLVARERRTSRLFMVRRRPRLFSNIPLEWVRPVDEQYTLDLLYNGFITSRLSTSDVPKIVAEDLRDLETILMPFFWKFSQKARHYANSYYSNIWAIIMAALATILFEVVTVIFLANNWHITLPLGISVGFLLNCLAILSAAMATYASVKNAQSEPQKHWVTNSLLAEELRTNYFLYLIHEPPYDAEDRFDQLKETVYNIRVRALEARAIPDLALSKMGLSRRSLHNESDIQWLVGPYMIQRMHYQLDYYERRIPEFEANSRFVVSSSVVGMMITTLLALSYALADSYGRNLVLLIPVVVGIPTTVLALYGFRWLYGWDRQADIFRDTKSRLERVASLMQGFEEWDSSRLSEVFPRVVSITEEIIYNEAKQWAGLQTGVVTRYKREGVIEVEPVFGNPPSESQFECDVFMIMPFADEFDPIYRNVIVPLVEKELRLTIKRGDDFFSEHEIMKDIWGGISASKLVIAECTGRNANVFYELGIAHTLGKPTIMITQNIDDTPFDLRHLRTVTYENTPDGLNELKPHLSKAIARLQNRYLGELAAQS